MRETGRTECIGEGGGWMSYPGRNPVPVAILAEILITAAMATLTIPAPGITVMGLVGLLWRTRMFTNLAFTIDNQHAGAKTEIVQVLSLIHI